MPLEINQPVNANGHKKKSMSKENIGLLKNKIMLNDICAALEIAASAWLGHSNRESPQAGKVKSNPPRTYSAHPAEPFKLGKPDPKGSAQNFNMGFILKRAKMILVFAFCILLLHLNSIAQKAAKPIRGTWITNVASEAMYNKENIEETINLCKKSGINNVYVVVWNKGETMYPSKVVEEYIGVKQAAVFGDLDPLKEMIEAGHKAGILVHAWFEFGFSYNYGDSNSIWQKRYPQWVGRDVKGNCLQKNGFFWWNGLHPDVQAFMNKLVLEVVNNYDIDGVQGDDRLPAMPSNGGYDIFTKKMYADEHAGAKPPKDCNDTAWVQWRANKLSAYIKQLYWAVKAVKPGCVVSWAPSIYPWSKEQYLQDWPAWLNGGYADYILPQLYRYDLKAYKKIVDELNTQVTKAQKSRVVPGILTSLGDGYLVKKKLLQQMIDYNRKNGYNGECTFYFETLKRLGNYYW